MDKFETNRPSKQSLIVYGGSFDPWHKGHAGAVEWICNHSDIPVCIVPTNTPWYKNKKLKDFNTRLAEIKPILKSEFGAQVSISTIENDIPSIEGHSYRLIQYLQQLPDVTELVLAVGADSWETLHTWTDIDDWFHRVHWIVLQRDQEFDRANMPWPKLRSGVDGIKAYDKHDLAYGTLYESSAHKILFGSNPLIDASSTEINAKQNP
jgi:nicotinate-nucleotide adenylyltransferase